jgi:GAF domain-containing protein
MHSILLIGSDKLADELLSFLPAAIPLTCAETMAAAEAYLRCGENSDLAPGLILLQAGDGPATVALCAQLRQKDLAAGLPIIAILAQPADRQAVLKAGADDYLLLPLSPEEVTARLSIHLRALWPSFNTLAEAINQMQSGLSLPSILDQSLQNLAEIFGAASAWLLWLNPNTGALDLAGSYNPPPLLSQAGSSLVAEAGDYLQQLRQSGGDRPALSLVQPCACLAQAGDRERAGLMAHLSLPLASGQRPVGLLSLAYPRPPRLLPPEQRTLAILGQHLGLVMEMFHLHQDMQIYATQAAFMILIARAVSERPDLQEVLSFTLEQAVTLLNASGGQIWLFSTGGRWLEPASVLTTTFTRRPNLAGRQPDRRARGQGLIGWVAAKVKPLHTIAAAADPRFDSQVDQLEASGDYSLLAIPLVHQQQALGVLAIYNNKQTPFSDQDTALLEGMAGLVVSAITNARMVQELRSYADRHRALYEMSQQIAAGLDLTTTLKRALHWTGRLFDVEISTLWLLDETQANLCLAAATGFELEPDSPPVISPENSLTSWVLAQGETVVVNDPAADARIALDMMHRLQTTLRNIIAAPMICQGQTIGVMSLMNKISGPFAEADLTLLSMVVDIIAVAVGNARLHSRTLVLMTEQERLHRQMLQAERLGTVGRLTASLSHEINNPMQAIHGALTLALEELADPEALALYIQTAMQESERVVQLLNRMRQIYRPQTEAPELLNPRQLLQEVIPIARKELARKQVILRADLAADPPLILAVANQLYLVFLSYILNLGDAIAAAGGGDLYLRLSQLPEAIQIEFLTDLPAPALLDQVNILTSAGHQAEAETRFSSYLSYDIVMALGGSLDFQQQDRQSVLRLKLPVSPPGLAQTKAPAA